jgi:hypothetical protein
MYSELFVCEQSCGVGFQVEPPGTPSEDYPTSHERNAIAKLETKLAVHPMNPNKNLALVQLQDRTARFQQIMEQLRQFMGGSVDSVNIWLNSPHPYLDNRTPQSFLDEDKPEVVEYLVWAMETGQPW